MKFVNITIGKPYYNTRKYLASYHDKSDYSNWFIKGYFSKR